MAEPDLLITAAPYPGASRSEDVLRHPAVQAMRAAQTSKMIYSNDWVCGTPYVLRAIETLAGRGGDLGDSGFVSPVTDFYLTNPIARASAVMAECSALARNNFQAAAE